MKNYLMKLNVPLVLALVFFSHCEIFSQDTKKVSRPDIPGFFLIDFGVNGTIGSPKEFRIGWWGSRTANVYYYYPIRIGTSKFMVSPGIGLGLERFKFKDNRYLADTVRLDTRFDLIPNVVNLRATYPGMKKSMMVMDYLDVPLEFRFNANPDDLARTFWVSVGGRAGWLFNPHSKIKYSTEGETRILKERYRHGLNQFRYGASLRIGMGNFNWFGYYNLSPLFEKDKGPSKTEMNTFTFGISIIGL
jgi:Outer membrane protein beta-barrel domain